MPFTIPYQAVVTSSAIGVEAITPVISSCQCSLVPCRKRFLLRLFVSLLGCASCVASAGFGAPLSSFLQAQRTDAAARALQAGQPGTEVLREVIRGAAAATDMDSREADRLATALASDQQLGQVR